MLPFQRSDGQLNGLCNIDLDAFGEVGCSSHMLKDLGEEVTYNDALRFNYYIGLALIENEVGLSDKEKAPSLSDKRGM